LENAPRPTEDEHEIGKTIAGKGKSGRTMIDFDFADSITDNVNAVAAVMYLDSSKFPSLDELKEAQPLCADFAVIYAYLLNGSLPENEQQARRIVIEAVDYVLDNHVLYHLYTPRMRRLQRAYAVVRQLRIPTQFREQVARELHDRIAHIGFDRL
jgi:hypothetical protein